MDTATGGGLFASHSWPEGAEVDLLFTTMLDEYADYVDNLCQTHSTEHTTQVFMLAAWLLFKFVNIHPFMDGNGRMCRLLANRVLAVIFPFPVPIFAISSFDDRNNVQPSSIWSCSTMHCCSSRSFVVLQFRTCAVFTSRCSRRVAIALERRSSPSSCARCSSRTAGIVGSMH